MSLQPMSPGRCCITAVRLLYSAQTAPNLAAISYSDLAPEQGFEPELLLQPGDRHCFASFAAATG